MGKWERQPSNLILAQEMPLLDPTTITKSLKADLLPYQKQGLHWMVQQERRRSVFEGHGTHSCDCNRLFENKPGQEQLYISAH